MEIAYVVLICIGLLEGLYICKKQRERNELLKREFAIDHALKELEKIEEELGNGSLGSD